MSSTLAVTIMLTNVGLLLVIGWGARRLARAQQSLERQCQAAAEAERALETRYRELVELGQQLQNAGDVVRQAATEAERAMRGEYAEAIGRVKAEVDVVIDALRHGWRPGVGGA